MFLFQDVSKALDTALRNHEDRMVGKKVFSYKTIEIQEREITVTEAVPNRDSAGFITGDFIDSVRNGSNITTQKTVRTKKYYVRTKFVQVEWNKYKGIENERKEVPELTTTREITEQEFEFYTLNPDKL